MSQSDHMIESNDWSYQQACQYIYHNTELRYWDWYWYQSLIAFLRVNHMIKSITQLN